MKEIKYVALSPTVLAVATIGEVNDWSAYIDSVEGQNHEKEYTKVAKEGSKLTREIAEVIFPEIKDMNYRK